MKWWEILFHSTAMILLPHFLVLFCVYFGCTRQQDVHLLAQIITDLLWSDEVISYLEIPGDYSDGKEPVMTINLTERFKIDHRALLWTNPTLRKSQFI